ncbi:ferredoxin [Mycobacterium sp. SMC-2]|uniref:ferredoxin n=1 Tax=Mycobacterium sp. SMC-2 TaxID=2857058 RepID=UPI0021B3BA50|nr:ferredoxin [Mycobacterium sp. SMC-2]UXA05898.1 ferredoxin [Mycobacterium sp. SMC-2]
MRVEVDYRRCEGHAICVGLVPKVFELGEDDEQVRVVDDTPDESDQSNVILAAKRCPTMAIKLTG